MTEPVLSQSTFVRKLVVGLAAGQTVEEVALATGTDLDTARHIAASPLIKAFVGRST